jgi:hypothetical protein
VTFCATCHRNRTHVVMAEGDLYRAARRAIRTDGAPADLALIEKAKAQLADSRAKRDEHEATCTTP